jgi:hypothetical protein
MSLALQQMRAMLLKNVDVVFWLKDKVVNVSFQDDDTALRAQALARVQTYSPDATIPSRVYIGDRTPFVLTALGDAVTMSNITTSGVHPGRQPNGKLVVHVFSHDPYDADTIYAKRKENQYW